jgi:monovalent cation:H+ antiporter-2, CPA2 family
VTPLERWLLAHSAWARRLEARQDATAALPSSTDEKYLSQQIVLVGYGRVGRRIAQALIAQNLPLVVVEQNREVVERLRSDGIQAVAGDAAEAEVLVQAHVATARLLVIATPDTLGVRQMMASARTLNPGIGILLRTHSETEARLLKEESVGLPVTVFLSESELAQAMVQRVLQSVAPPAVPHPTSTH